MFPQNQFVSGSTVSVDVKLAGASDLGSYGFTLSWDANILDLVGVTNGTFLGSTGRSVTCGAPVKAPGSVTFGCQTSGGAAGPQGAGVLTTIQFTILSLGVTPVSLSAVTVATSTGVPYSISANDGTITTQ